MRTKKISLEIPDYCNQDEQKIIIEGKTINLGKVITYNWTDGYIIKVENLEDEFAIIANKEGLISLANHCLNLAQEGIPNGSHIHFDDGNSLKEGSFPLIIERDDSLTNE